MPVGAYFIPLVSNRRACLFGHIVDGEMESYDIGRIVEEQWLHTAAVRPNVEWDAFVIMPKQFHGILVIVEDIGGGATAGIPVGADSPFVSYRIRKRRTNTDISSSRRDRR